MLRLFALILFCLSVLILLTGATVAQDGATTVRFPPAPTPACPTNLVCIDWQGLVIEVDPTCGVVQAIVTRESLARTTDILDGVTESYGLRGVIVAADMGEYKVVGAFSGPATGPLEGVRFGHVGCLVWDGAEE